MARLLKLSPPICKVDVQRNQSIPMFDGVTLLTDHYAPRGMQNAPTILIRTPYGRGKELSLFGGYFLAELPAQRFAERGYHVVVQGTRGRFDSGGEFSPHEYEAADGAATLDWLRQQAWFTGALGLWGPSYLGYTQWATAVNQPPELKAMMPLVTSTENYTVTHPDGAFGLETRLRWSQGMHMVGVSHQQNAWGALRTRFFGGSEKRLTAAFDHIPLI